MQLILPSVQHCVMLSHATRTSDCSSCGNPLENYFSFDCGKDEVLQKFPELMTEWVDMPLQSPSTSVAQAKKDFRRQKILLNGVAFTPELNSASNNDLFCSTLYNICSALTRMCPLPDVRSADIAESVMQYSCRSSTGADSFFAVHQLFSIQDTIVMQHEREGQATIEISLFQAMGSICVRSDCKNSYILVDSEEMGNERPTPWLYVDTYIRDEINFRTGQHLRTLTLVPAVSPLDCTGVRPKCAVRGSRRPSCRPGSTQADVSEDIISERDN